MDNDNNLADPNYGMNYISWKKWGHNFSFLKKNESAYYSAEISRTKNKFLKDSKVLEIGFGNGGFLKYAKEMGWDITGTELNHELVNIANSLGYKAFVAEDLSIFKSDSFDLVVAFDVLEHIPNDKFMNFIFEVKRVLVPDGYFIARFPNGDSPFGLKIQNGDFTHISSIGSGKVFSLQAITKMKLIYFGGEAQPIIGTTFINVLHKIFSLPIKLLINLIVGIIFFPREKVDFCALNSTMIFRCDKNN
jgi:2-polyprenyl-3-methyl-5-hydroxy-6-metoxy-1,4-benzoquinol methylase